jgi:hypothetical protein
MQRSVHKRLARSLLTMLLAGLTTQPSLAQGPSRTLLRNANLLRNFISFCHQCLPRSGMGLLS